MCVQRMLCQSCIQLAFPITQGQYIFVYDAVRELLLLGDTTIKASEMRRVIAQLKSKSGGKGTGYQQQFAVSGETCTTECAAVHAVDRTVLGQMCYDFETY